MSQVKANREELNNDFINFIHPWIIQPDQINLAVFFWYLHKGKLYKCTLDKWQGDRKTRPCITGHPVDYKNLPGNIRIVVGSLVSAGRGHIVYVGEIHPDPVVGAAKGEPAHLIHSRLGVTIIKTAVKDMIFFPQGTVKMFHF